MTRGTATGSPAPPAPPAPPPSKWQLFLDNKTPFQRALFALAALATAVVGIGTAVVTVAGWVSSDGDGGESADPGTETVRRASEFDGKVIQSGSRDADDLVRFLVEHSKGDPVELDLTVLAPGDEIDPFLRLWYNCRPGAVVGDGACNGVRLEFGSDIPVRTENPLGWRFHGVYRVDVHNGVDYGTDLDIAFDDVAR